jgi:hypothetical protein
MLYRVLWWGQYWGLNSRLCSCSVGSLPLDTHLQFFLLCYFRDRVTVFLSRPAWTTILLFILLVIAGMAGMHHYTQLFPLLRWGLMNIFCLGWPGTSQSQQPSQYLGMVRAYHWAQLLVELGSYELFALPGFLTVILPISAFQIAKITVVSHRCLAIELLLNTYLPSTVLSTVAEADVWGRASVLHKSEL